MFLQSQYSDRGNLTYYCAIATGEYSDFDGAIAKLIAVTLEEKFVRAASPQENHHQTLTHLAKLSGLWFSTTAILRDCYHFRALNHIHILIPQPGPTTGEMLLDLLARYPDGATIGELSHQLNRPVSMLLIVLKLLKSEGKVRTTLSESGMTRVYFLS